MPRRRVVVIDDSPELLSLLTEVLVEQGRCDVQGWPRRSTTVYDLAAAHPDLVVLDLDPLPGWDAGRELLTDTRSPGEGLSRLPVIGYTTELAQLRDNDDDIARMDGVYVLQKPFTLQAFMSMVEHATRRLAPHRMHKLPGSAPAAPTCDRWGRIVVELDDRGGAMSFSDLPAWPGVPGAWSRDRVRTPPRAG